MPSHFLLSILFGVFSINAWAAHPAYLGHAPLPPFQPCEPVSDFFEDKPDASASLPSLDFCAEWNPEFSNNGNHCCAKSLFSRRARRRQKCAPDRRKGSYCDEITDEEKEYTDLVNSGKVADVLDFLKAEIGKREAQAYCSVNSGFLAFGRRLVPTALNRVRLRSPNRCTEFGTDPMVAMLEWTGREVAQQYAAPDYSGVRLLVGDISAPRGGCMSGRGGRKGHASHTTGQDVDVGFLTVKAGAPSPEAFHRNFDAKTNWWVIKRILHNPFACVKVIFLDRSLIRKLSKVAYSDQDWKDFHRFLRHMPGHKNHFHVRIGDQPGSPGCVAGANPELEFEEDADAPDLASGQGADINE